MEDIIKLPKGFRMAKIASKHSSYKQQLGAAIYKSGKCISIGFNQIKSHPKLANKDRFYSLHAEMSCLLNVKQDIKNASIFVYREFKNGKLALAKPCHFCISSIIESKIISKIYYTTPNYPYYEYIKI